MQIDTAQAIPETQTPPIGERLLRRPEVERKVGMTRSTLYRMIDKGLFPAPVHIGGVAAWPLSEVDQWIDELKENRSASLRPANQSK